MQPPPVQYAMTSDGVRIAYTVSGQGPVVVLVTEPVVSHAQLEWSHPLFSRIYRRGADRRTLVRFDARSTGLSQRGVERPVESGAVDLDAVVRRLGLERFGVVAVQGSTIPVIMWVAEHPEAVEKLVFIDGFARARDIANTPTSRALVAAGRADFFLATEAIGAAALGAGRDEVRDYGAYIRQCIDASYFTSLDDEPERLDRADVTSLLPEIITPALVMHHRDLPYVTAEMSRDLAARLPNAQYVELPGGWADDPEGLIDLVLDFLVGAEVQASGTAEPPRAGESGVRTILFTDIEGHTQMMQRLGDARGREVLREHERITRETLRAHGGTEVKSMGDGFMASFGSVAAAAECAVSLQKAFAEHGVIGAETIAVRIGLNAGEPVSEDGDLFGSSVILAARIAAHAQGGVILVSDVVRGLLSGKGFLFADRGDVVLRGFEDPARLYEVRWKDGQ